MQYFWIDKSLTNEDFEYTINRCYTSYMQQTNDVLFNLLDSHDTKRLRSDVKNLDEYYSNTAFQWHFDTKNKTIRQERKMLSALYEASDYVIDTSHLTAQGLLQELKEIYASCDTKQGLEINVMAFGFKYGMPLDADLVFDVRCFPNPFYIDELKHKTGNDKEVQDYVMSFPKSVTFMEKLEDFMEFMITLYIEEGKISLTIAIGCTGG